MDASSGAWEHQTRAVDLARQYQRDDDWILSASASSLRGDASFTALKSYADHGTAADVLVPCLPPPTRSKPERLLRASSAASLSRSSLSNPSLASSMASLKIRPFEKNPITGCLPDETRETRDWTTHSHRTHTRLPMRQPKGAGMETRFGVRDEVTGKTIYLKHQYGVPEALGTTRPVTHHGGVNSRSKALRVNAGEMRFCRLRGRDVMHREEL